MTVATSPARSRETLTGCLRLLRARARLSPTTVDALLVTVLFVPNAVFIRDELSAHPWLLALQAGLLVPLVWRRRAPLAVFGAVATAAFVQWLADVQLSADVALLIALYTVAAYCDRHRTLLAGAVLEVGIVLNSLRWAPEDRVVGDIISLTAMAVAAAVIGTNARARRAYLATVEDRAPTSGA